MLFLIALSLLLVAAAGTAVALSRDPVRQAVVLGAYGLAMSILFVLVGAADVALSQLAVGAAITPLMVVLTVAKIRRDAGPRKRREER